jgi:hypothetical protein
MKSLQIVAGILLPLSVAIIWGIYCAPASSYRLDGWALIGLKMSYFWWNHFCISELRQNNQRTYFCFAGNSQFGY